MKKDLKEAKRIRHNNARKAKRLLMTPEEKLAEKEANSLLHKNRTAQQIELDKVYKRQRYHQLSAEKKQERAQKSKEYYLSLSDEKKRSNYEKQKLKHANRSEEELIQFKLKKRLYKAAQRKKQKSQK